MRSSIICLQMECFFVFVVFMYNAETMSSNTEILYYSAAYNDFFRTTNGLSIAIIKYLICSSLLKQYKVFMDVH